VQSQKPLLPSRDINDTNKPVNNIIAVNTDRPLFYLIRANDFSVIDAGIDRPQIFHRHVPERLLDDNRDVMFIAHHFYYFFIFQGISGQAENHRCLR